MITKLKCLINSVKHYIPFEYLIKPNYSLPIVCPTVACAKIEWLD